MVAEVQRLVEDNPHVCADGAVLQRSSPGIKCLTYGSSFDTLGLWSQAGYKGDMSSLLFYIPCETRTYIELGDDVNPWHQP